MATSRSFRELGERLRVRAAEIKTGVERTVRKAALRADQVAVTTTPVDTGRAKGNWVPTVGAPYFGPERPEDKSGQAVLDECQRVVATYRSPDSDTLGSIFLTNGVPYIVRLDNGWSKKAPRGMSRFAIQAAREVVRRTKIFLSDGGRILGSDA